MRRKISAQGLAVRAERLIKENGVIQFITSMPSLSKQSSNSSPAGDIKPLDILRAGEKAIAMQQWPVLDDLIQLALTQKSIEDVREASDLLDICEYLRLLEEYSQSPELVKPSDRKYLDHYRQTIIDSQVASGDGL